MLLAIDIGNTHTVFGVYKDARLMADWRVSSTLQRTEDEAGAHIKLLMKESGIQPADIDRIGISSVVPNLTDIFAAMAAKYFSCHPVIVSASLDLGIKIRYHDPLSVGADRICNAVAGYDRHGGPLIIIDFGTATTYDVVAANGDYLGGVIAPGIETSAADLHRRAAKLPKIELHVPEQTIGQDTVTSMQAGILFGALDSLSGMVERIQKELKAGGSGPAKVIATGGFSTLMAQHTSIIGASEPSLVLDGVRLICDRVQRSSTSS